LTKEFQIKQLNPVDAQVLKDLESLTGKKLSKVEKISVNPKMAYTSKNGEITGIGLYNCNLGKLPESIGNLKSLKILDLGNNYISEFPESIGNLKALQNLNIPYNQLKSLPDSIKNLKALNKLALHHNRLIKMPKSLLKLPNLRYLNVKFNPIRTKKRGTTQSEDIIHTLKKNGVEVKAILKLKYIRKVFDRRPLITIFVSIFGVSIIILTLVLIFLSNPT
jgi:hypothetical protein